MSWRDFESWQLNAFNKSGEKTTLLFFNFLLSSKKSSCVLNESKTERILLTTALKKLQTIISFT